MNILDLKLENIRLKKELAELRKQTVIDPLTKLYNARALLSFLEEETAYAKRYKNKLSLIFIDIDNFKKYNDSYGHSQGDEALKTAAKTMRKSVRSSDVVGRWTAGEEFIIILPNTDKQGAFIMAEKLRKNIEKTEIKLVINKLKNKNYKHITISLGISEFHKDAKTLIEEADKAAYKSKELGKNKTSIY